MNLSEKFGFIIGIMIVLFGLVMIVGGVSILFDPEEERIAIEWILWVALLGILPSIGGLKLCQNMKKSGTKRENQIREQRLLQLAKENDGRLTITEVTLKMSLDSTEAKKILDECHLNGMADISINTEGSVEYQFRM